MTWKDLTKEEIEAFQRVQDWLTDVATRRTGSEKTKHEFISHLTDYCNHRQKTPDELAAEGDIVAKGKKRTTVAEKNLSKYFVYLEKEKIVKSGKRKGQKGLKRGSAKTAYGAIRSFLRSCEIPFFGKTPSGGSRAKSIELKKPKIREVINASGLQESYTICGLACTGMRPEDFGALTYGDVKEDYIALAERLYIEKESMKEDLWFGVFLNRQTTKLLRMIVESRKRNGEVITDETVLLRERGDPTKPVEAQRVAAIVKDAGERVGMYLTPKLFRKNFRTNASPVIGRDATCKMASWTIPGVGKAYFLPPRSKCLELYLKIEKFFTYEEEVDKKEAEIDSIINLAISRGMPIEKAEKLREVWRTKKMTPKQCAKDLHVKMKQYGHEAGGLPFEVQARKALADILVGAVEDVKKRLAEKG